MTGDLLALLASIQRSREAGRCPDCEWSPRRGFRLRSCAAHTCKDRKHDVHPSRRCGWTPKTNDWCQCLTGAHEESRR